MLGNPFLARMLVVWVARQPGLDTHGGAVLGLQQAWVEGGIGLAWSGRMPSGLV